MKKSGLSLQRGMESLRKKVSFLIESVLLRYGCLRVEASEFEPLIRCTALRGTLF